MISGICQGYTGVTLWCLESIRLYESLGLEISCHCSLDWFFQPYLPLSGLPLYLWALSSLMLHWSSACSLFSFLLHYVSIWRVCHSVFGFTGQWHFYFRNCDYLFQNLRLGLFTFSTFFFIHLLFFLYIFKHKAGHIDAHLVILVLRR